MARKKRLASIIFIAFTVIVLVLCVLIVERNWVAQVAFNYLVKGKNETSAAITQKDHFDMKEELKTLSGGVKQQYLPMVYNSQNVKFLQQEIAADKSPLHINQNYLQGDLAFQYLASGYPDSAIEVIRRLNLSPGFGAKTSFRLHQLNNAVDASFFFNSYFHNSFLHPERQIGLCYLREGELENCLACHNAEMCIMPISGAGVYQKKSPSANAIKAFTADLEQHGHDATTEWLLNLAYNTLGLYPDSVPKKYLIDFHKYDSKYNGITFNDVALDVGIDERNLYGGTVVEDFNNDGYADIFTTSADLESDVKLYLYQPDSGTFKCVTQQANLDGITGGVNAIHADYNNDGWEDIFVMRGGWMTGEAGKQPCSLLRNNGDGTFTDVTNEAGLLNYLPCHTACWADFDNDGYLDLFVGHENGPSSLFKNNGDGTFTDVSKESGLMVNDFVKAAVWGDVNNDGLQDLFISCYGSKNKLFINKGRNAAGKFTFEERAENAGVTLPLKSFSCFMADFNNDGWPDIFCSGYNMDMELLARQYKGEHPEFEPSEIYINNKDGTFTPLKTKSLDRSITAMGINYGDIDKDGWLDFYIGTGFPAYEALVPNVMFRNVEGKDIEDITFSAGLGHLQKGHGIAFADFTHTGNLDIFINIGGAYESDRFTPALFKNSGNDNNWVSLKLQGVSSNRSAIGAKIEVKVKNNGVPRSIYSWVNTGGSYGASPLEQFIGLGKTDIVDEIIVTWPKTGRTQHFTSLEVDKAYKITEDIPAITTLPYKKAQFKDAGPMSKSCRSPVMQMH